MDSHPLVSIIIPLYNYEQYIVDCLLSCVNQEYKNVEIIVVDDASTDRSREMVEKVNDTRITLLRHESNLGYSTAKNTGIMASHGEYITTLDADDMLTLPSIRKRVEHLNVNSGVDVAHGVAYKMDGGGSYSKALRNQATYPFDTRAEIHAQTVMVRKAVYECYGLYYEKLRSKADKEMWVRLKMAGVIFEKIKTKCAFYRKHKKSMQRMRDRNKKYDREITQIFNERIAHLKREGITPQNTRMM